MVTRPADGDSNLNTAREELCDAVPEAAETIRGLPEADDERVRLRAAEAVLDRAGLTKAETAWLTTVKTEVGDVDKHDRDIAAMLEY